MEESAKQKYEASSAQLRSDLKRFEAGWARDHDGKKPGRQDIKQNPEIAQKYKQYNHVRDVLEGKVAPKSKEASKLPSKRKPVEACVQTPSKKSKVAHTPSKLRHQAIDDATFETPSARRLFSPAIPTSIGPTPQRDGRILGLFDLLEEHSENTPSKTDCGNTAGDLDKIQATPSKQSDGLHGLRLGRTPTSASKRDMREAFVTPRHRREGNPLGARTPNSVSKLQLSTPSFLRRAPLPCLDENGDYISPQRPLRLPRKPLGKTLSSVVASLRKLEEEKLDDDLEALREMEEAEAEGGPTETAARPAPKPKPKPKDSSSILEPDSQGPRLLGGFDDEAMYDSPTEEALGRDGQPLRIYKKKGQKRTTRRVNMKPTRAKRPQAPAEEEPREDEDDDEIVAETQFDATKANEKPPPPAPDMDSDSDFDVIAAATGADDKAAAKKTGPKDQKKKAGVVKKAARKVNELAHANFKRLKLKNNGAKGGPGLGSRFRRRR
ncbi:DNA replication/checkpoint protein [Xylariaceae sp. FL0804]|nr:DNA replication/checkpoint protein [Xylariaceae sp. FL0804]